jgi:hypothetical protein
MIYGLLAEPSPLTTPFSGVKLLSPKMYIGLCWLLFAGMLSELLLKNAVHMSTAHTKSTQYARIVSPADKKRSDI